MVLGKTLEDIGFKLYYDRQGTREVLDTDVINVNPGETLDFWLLGRPTQKEDGKWYHKTYRFLGDAPFFVFGMYEVEDALNDIYIGNNPKNNNMNLNGKIEEVALWHRALSEAEVLNYHTNLVGMIGSGVGYKYQTESEAFSDGLHAYYIPADFPLFGVPYHDPGYTTNFIKSRLFDIGSGKHNNAVILNYPDDEMYINNTKMMYNFSLNVRFYLEEFKSFTLFYADGIGELRYDDDTGMVHIDIFPFYSPKFSYSFSLSNIDIHKWYDLCMTVEDGVMKIFINGEKHYETTIPSIRGVKDVQINHSNIESVDVRGLACVAYRDYRRTEYSEDALMQSYLHGGKHIELSNMDDFFRVLIDKKNSRSAWIGLGNTSGGNNYGFGIDSGSSNTDIGYYVYNSYRGKLIHDGPNNKMRLYFINSGTNDYYGVPENGFYNIISTGCPVKIRVVFKTTFSDPEIKLSPNIFVMPGSKIIEHEYVFYPDPRRSTDLSLSDRDIRGIRRNYEDHDSYPSGFLAYRNSDFDISYIINDSGDPVPYSKTICALTYTISNWNWSYKYRYRQFPNACSQFRDSVASYTYIGFLKEVHAMRSDKDSYGDV